MRGAKKPSPLFIAAIALLLLVAVPHAAQAQTVTPFKINDCMSGLANALTKAAQDKTIGQAKMWANSPVPTLNTTCITNLMTLGLNIGTLTDPFGIILHLIEGQVLQMLINQVCGLVQSIITEVNNMAKSLLCIPLPHFGLSLNLNLGAFGGGNCSGVQLLPNLGIVTGPRATLPGVWQIWNFKPQ